jgi:hypothetical protein
MRSQHSIEPEPDSNRKNETNFTILPSRDPSLDDLAGRKEKLWVCTKEFVNQMVTRRFADEQDVQYVSKLKNIISLGAAHARPEHILTQPREFLPRTFLPRPITNIRHTVRRILRLRRLVRLVRLAHAHIAQRRSSTLRQRPPLLRRSHRGRSGMARRRQWRTRCFRGLFLFCWRCHLHLFEYSGSFGWFGILVVGSAAAGTLCGGFYGGVAVRGGTVC